MANNIAVKISADVADLTAKRAIMSAELKAATRDLNGFAKEAKATGSTDALRTSMLEAATAVAGTKAQIAALDSELKANSVTTAKFSGAQEKASGTGRVLTMQLSQVVQQSMAGTNVLQALAMQLPDIAVGMSSAGSAAGGFASILGGPWGIAATSAISLAIALAPSLLGIGSAAEDAAPKVDALTEALKRLREEQGTSADEGQVLVKIARLQEEALNPKVRRARGESADSYEKRADKRRAEIRAEIEENQQLVRWNEAVRRSRETESSSTPKSRPSGLSGREIDAAGARSIAEGAGFTVTSGTRSRAEQQRLYDTVRTPENPVAKPGTSAHERGNALDIAFGSGVTPQTIRKAFDDEGVRLTKLLKETGHYHIEWSTAGNDKAASAARREAKAAADEAERARKEKAAQDRQLALGAAATQLSVQQIDIADKRQAVQADFAGGGIDADQKRDLMKRLAEEEAADEIAAQEAKKQAYAGDVVAVQQAADQQRLIRADLAAQLNEIERQHTADLQRENELRARNAREAAQRQADQWRSVNQQILSAESQLIEGVLSGRQGMGQALISIGARVLQSEIVNSVRYLTEKRLLAAQGAAIDQASSQRGILATLLGEGRKTAVTAAGERARTTLKTASAARSAAITAASTAPHVAAESAKTAATAVGSTTRAGIERVGFFGKILSLLGIQVGAHAASETGKTAATAAGAGARAAAETTANVTKLVAQKAMTLAELGSQVALAGAGGTASMAAAPFPLNLGAPAFGASMAATAASFGSLAAFAKGTNELPTDMVAQIHAGERIVPAADNREMMQIMRQGASGGGGGGSGKSRRSGNVHLHYNPKINGGAPFSQQLSSHKRELAEMLRGMMRSGALSFS